MLAVELEALVGEVLEEGASVEEGEKEGFGEEEGEEGEAEEEEQMQEVGDAEVGLRTWWIDLTSGRVPPPPVKQAQNIQT